jgi:hypothetical protein
MRIFSSSLPIVQRIAVVATHGRELKHSLHLSSYGENPRTKTPRGSLWRHTDVVTSVETFVTSRTLHPCCSVPLPNHLQQLPFILGYTYSSGCHQRGSIFVAADSYAIACFSGNLMGMLHVFLESQLTICRAYSWYDGPFF